MIYLIAFVLLIAVIFAPQWWATRTFRQYSGELTHIPGTGGDLARHLLRQFQIVGVKVEKTTAGDHYDPESKTVRLSQSNHDGRSLTAVAVAAHEVGHAIQHHQNDRMLALRGRLVTVARTAERAGAFVMIAMPVVALLTRSPASGVMMIALGAASMLIATVVHLVTLPVELDASFGKALPILQKGAYVRPEDERVVRRILRAAALTYVAGSLASLLNLARWIALLRR